MEVYEPTPRLRKASCKALALAIAFGIGAGPVVAAVVSGWYFHWSGGLAAGVFVYLLAGVISSKMRQVSLPLDQREMSLNSHEIARWYVARYLLCDA